MKRKIRKIYQAVIAELTEHKNTFFVYLGLRLLVLGILILQIFHQNYENAFLCILTLILMITPSVIQATLKVEFPSPLEIIVLIFIFSAEILGEIRSFYMRFLYWDTVLHTLNGFLCAAIGFFMKSGYAERYCYPFYTFNTSEYRRSKPIYPYYKYSGSSD